MNWRLMESGSFSASVNMSRDAFLFEEALSGPAFFPLLRIYRFSRPSVTYGYSQKSFSRDLPEGMDSAMRITGGGAVVHRTDFTYSVVARMTDSEKFRSLEDSYRVFHEIVRSALSRMGFEARFFDGTGRRGLARMCFSAPVKYDLVCQGKKIAGAAEKRSGNFFLHQGTVELAPFIGATAGYPALYDRMKEAFLISFTDYFHACFFMEPDNPSDVLSTGRLAFGEVR